MNHFRPFKWIKQNRKINVTILLSLFGLILLYTFSPSPSKNNLSYTQDIQPILAAKCYTCHGPDEADRKAGLRLDIHEGLFDTLESGKTAISQKKLTESELLKRISSTDPDFMMPPPEGPTSLEIEEIQLISQWVKEGVSWENHWSYEAIRQQELPKIRSKRWGQNPIDAFIRAAQKKQGLKPSPEADKRTLIRRLYYDLHGLPPSPEKVEAFLADNSKSAYENLVDSLLASPRYGERWARHWLDVVHYGETHGYDKDKRRPNAWPYRDYVINALNEDIPYSRFIQDQLAGDILYPDDPQSTVALGFLAAGPWDFVGHVELQDNTKDKRIVRNLDRDDMVSTAMATFTGLTVQCARCHDHKFDPIRQADYYSLQAVFAGIDRADRPYDEDPEVHRKRIRWKGEKEKLIDKLDELGEQLGEREKKQIEEVIHQQNALKRKVNRLKRPPSKTFGFHSAFEQQADLTKWVEIDLGDIYDLEKVVLFPAFKGEGLFMPGYGFPLRFKIEASSTADFSDPHLIIDFSQEDHHERTDVPYVMKVEDVKGRFVRLIANKLWKGRGQDHFLAMAEMQVFSGGKNVARNKTVKASDSFSSDNWHPAFLADGYNSFNLIGGEDLPKEQQRKVLQEERKLKILEIKENKIRRSVLNKEDRNELDEIRTFLAELEDSVAKLPAPSYVYAAATDFRSAGQFRPADSIRPIYRLNRGDTEQPQEEVQPGTMATFDVLPSRFELAEKHTEGDRRLALAQWMTYANNAFTWRSIVNRVWQYHLGRPIVATPNDFGKMGTPPTHPELLDYLAHEFLANGQSLKWLHKLILTSATYKQAVSDNERNNKIDSENRFLWRANRRQLEAEAVRDGVLAISGKLDLRMGGLGFDAFRYEDDHSPRYIYKDYDANDPSSFRRAIYRFIVRSVPDPLMSTLDCADPSQSVAVRNETVTALQALSALNNPFMVRQAAFFAERLQAEADGLEAQLTRAYALALQRKPSRDELSELESYAEKHGLAAACRLIFAMNEFLYVD